MSWPLNAPGVPLAQAAVAPPGFVERFVAPPIGALLVGGALWRLWAGRFLSALVAALATTAAAGAGMAVVGVLEAAARLPAGVSLVRREHATSTLTAALDLLALILSEAANGAMLAVLSAPLSLVIGPVALICWLVGAVMAALMARTAFRH